MGSRVEAAASRRVDEKTTLSDGVDNSHIAAQLRHRHSYETLSGSGPEVPNGRWVSWRIQVSRERSEKGRRGAFSRRTLGEMRMQCRRHTAGRKLNLTVPVRRGGAVAHERRIRGRATRRRGSRPEPAGIRAIRHRDPPVHLTKLGRRNTEPAPRLLPAALARSCRRGEGCVRHDPCQVSSRI